MLFSTLSRFIRLGAVVKAEFMALYVAKIILNLKKLKRIKPINLKELEIKTLLLPVMAALKPEKRLMPKSKKSKTY